MRATFPLKFSLEKVKVSGNSRLKSGKIEDYLKNEIGSNIFSVNLRQKKMILENHRWIKEVDINLVLPDAIQLNVIEEEPAVIWKMSGKLYILNDKGKIIEETIDTAQEKLLVISGESAPKKIKEIKKILSVSPRIASEVSVAKLISNRRWSLKYKNDILIELPEVNAAKAIHLLDKVDKKHGLLSHNISSVDLRLEERMVLKLGKDSNHGPILEEGI